MDDPNALMEKIAGVTKKITEIVGPTSQCIPDHQEGGVTCINESEEKIYQVTKQGTSVSKLGVNVPDAFDIERDGIKMKGINDNCSISTKDDQYAIMMCYTHNSDPYLLDAGDNMEEMNEKLNDALSKAM